MKQFALVGMLLTATACAAAWFGAKSDPLAWRASGTAALIVWISGAASLLIAALPGEPASRVTCLLGAMLVRMSLPLAALALMTATQHNVDSPFPASTSGYLVLLYLVGLAVEIPLIVRWVPATGSPAPPPAETA